MSRLIDYTSEILVAIVVIFSIWGMGYMITLTMNQTQEFKSRCVDAGMQYSGGSCLK